MPKCSSLVFVLCAAALVTGACFAADNLPARPSNAQAGECWCLVTIPAQYKTVTEKCMVTPASCRFESVPAVFETREERVCVKPEGKRCIEVPAEYRTEEYRVCVEKEKTIKHKIPAVYEDRCYQVCVEKEKTVKHKIPAVYRTEEYQVCAAPARTEWRRSDCPTGTNVSATGEQLGECWCLVTIPARYETKCRQVCVEKERCVEEKIPAVFETRTKKVCVEKEKCIKETIPAVFETRTRQVCVKKASKTYECIPAEFKTVQKQVCVKPESKRRIEIPAVYEDRSRQVLVCPARQEWRKVDCGAPGATSNIPASMTTKTHLPPAPLAVSAECGSCKTEHHGCGCQKCSHDKNCSDCDNCPVGIPAYENVPTSYTSDYQ